MEFIDLKTQYEEIQNSINKRISEVILSTKFIGGRQVNELEEKLAAYVGRKYCITCGNGTDALQLTFMAIGVGANDAVFCPDMTFVASVEPACMLGASPIFVDIDKRSYNINPEELEKRIIEVKRSGNLIPKAVVAVDFLGNPANYKEITDICNRYNIFLIEDAAQGMGATYKGRRCGSFGDIACTSFFPSKPLGCYGDGGAIFTDNDELALLIDSIKVHGKGRSKYDNVRIGINSRLDTIQAAVLLSKMEVLDKEMTKRQELARKYNDALKQVVQIPYIEENNFSAYAQYCIILKSYEERQRIIEALRRENIPSLIYYPNTLHSLPAFGFAKDANKDDFNNSKKYAQCNLGLPFSPYLSDKDQNKIIKVICDNIEF